MVDPPSPFDLAATELARLGITLSRLPGEYRVNYRNGGVATARVAETLEEALAAGRAMAAERTDAQTNRGGPRRRQSRRPRTAKAYNRRLRKQHMRKLRARAIRQNDKKE